MGPPESPTARPENQEAGRRKRLPRRPRTRRCRVGVPPEIDDDDSRARKRGIGVARARLFDPAGTRARAAGGSIRARGRDGRGNGGEVIRSP